MNCIENCIKFLREYGYEPSLRKGRNDTYCCIDIPRHNDDFWKSSEYKECENILANNLIEGFYGNDIYTLFVHNEEQEDYDNYFKLSVWAYCRDVERVIRPFSTSDFERDYFIPDL